MKLLPYGVSDFKVIRRDDLYYVDKTPYLQLMEDANRFLFYIRPRRFGKSLLIDMMAAYYDIESKEQFSELFGNLYVGTHPTSLANRFQVMRLDFSRVSGQLEELKDKFNSYCSRQFEDFATRYAKYYEPRIIEQVMNSTDANDKIIILTTAAKRLGHRLYLIVDEYDNFTNNILANYGKEEFYKLTHAEGFYREMFKQFKGSFERIFMIGVSPVTLDDLTSGYNIDWNISNDPVFNSMLGFSDDEVRQMLSYYKNHGKIQRDIEDIIEDMRPWYDNYCFSVEMYGKEKVFNCDMALYYIQHLIRRGKAPEEMVDKNIRTDFSKLRQLVELDRSIQRDMRIRAIEKVIDNGSVDLTLRTSFPAMEVTEIQNFMSLLYYYGMLTIGGTDRGVLRMVIPNECVRVQYWNFLTNIYQSQHKIDLGVLEDYFRAMAFDGKWENAIRYIAKAYKDNSSLRNSIGGEHNINGFFKAYLGICDYTLLCPELELNYGYGDFVLVPCRRRFSDANHAYVIELKYCKPRSRKETWERLESEAAEQACQYASDPKLLKAIHGSTLHCIVIVFQGPNLKICHEI